MNSDKKCRLCWGLNPDSSHTLYDGNGGCTEVYEITVKYFDPMVGWSVPRLKTSQIIF